MMLIRGLKSNAHNIGAYMNINKIVKDSVSSIKNTYDNTTLNPFKMPEKITVELVVNYKESLKSLSTITEDELQDCIKFFKIISKKVNKELK